MAAAATTSISVKPASSLTTATAGTTAQSSVSSNRDETDSGSGTTAPPLAGSAHSSEGNRSQSVAEGGESSSSDVRGAGAGVGAGSSEEVRRLRQMQQRLQKEEWQRKHGIAAKRHSDGGVASTAVAAATGGVSGRGMKREGVAVSTDDEFENKLMTDGEPHTHTYSPVINNGNCHRGFHCSYAIMHEVNCIVAISCN